jgi:hypothetical protein
MYKWYPRYNATDSPSNTLSLPVTTGLAAWRPWGHRWGLGPWGYQGRYKQEKRRFEWDFHGEMVILWLLYGYLMAFDGS